MNYDSQAELNKEHLVNPVAGDYWHEMFSPYFLVMKNLGNGELVICDSIIDYTEGWAFNIYEARTIKHEDLAAWVTYQRIDGFVADVMISKKRHSLLDSWQDAGEPRNNPMGCPPEIRKTTRIFSVLTCPSVTPGILINPTSRRCLLGLKLIEPTNDVFRFRITQLGREYCANVGLEYETQHTHKE